MLNTGEAGGIQCFLSFSYSWGFSRLMLLNGFFSLDASHWIFSLNFFHWSSLMKYLPDLRKRKPSSKDALNAKRRADMLALMADDCRSSSYGVNEHLHPLTYFYFQSISLFGTDLSPMLANEHGYTTRLQRHDHFLHYFHISTFCTGNITIHIDIIKYLGNNYV